jgi:hypothetical protein
LAIAKIPLLPGEETVVEPFSMPVYSPFNPDNLDHVYTNA